MPVIDQPWPKDDLEYVEACPYCASKDRSLAHNDVQDWSFYSARGKWTYWQCAVCDSLYLSPRPTENSIGSAYVNYYTHHSNPDGIKQKLKTRLKNECYFHWFDVEVGPRLHLPKSVVFLFNLLKRIFRQPFVLESLVTLPKGKLLDVGCGSGNILRLARQLGWEVTGLEIDANAVKAAREHGLNVIQGDYRKLAYLSENYDCVICSHVLEHVHQPLELLSLLTKVLKPQGTLLLSSPNANSHVRGQFGNNWRGLEAPRHLAIPALQKIIAILQDDAFEQIQQVNIYGATVLESNRIGKRLRKLNILQRLIFRFMQNSVKGLSEPQSDFIQIIARKGLQ